MNYLWICICFSLIQWEQGGMNGWYKKWDMPWAEVFYELSPLVCLKNFHNKIWKYVQESLLPSSSTANRLVQSTTISNVKHYGVILMDPLVFFLSLSVAMVIFLTPKPNPAGEVHRVLPGPPPRLILYHCQPSRMPVVSLFNCPHQTQHQNLCRL